MIDVDAHAGVSWEQVAAKAVLKLSLRHARAGEDPRHALAGQVATIAERQKQQLSIPRRLDDHLLFTFGVQSIQLCQSHITCVYDRLWQDR